MRILAGQDQEFEGTLQLSPGIKVGYLQQEPVLDMKSTVLENIAPALAPTKAMLTEFEEVIALSVKGIGPNHITAGNHEIWPEQ